LYKEFPDYGLKLSIGKNKFQYDIDFRRSNKFRRFPSWLGQDFLSPVPQRISRNTFLWRQNFLSNIFLSKGGNDYEIYTSEKVKGNTVNSPEDTISQI